MIEKALEEIKEFIKDKKQVDCRLTGRVETEELLRASGFEMLVLWDYSFRLSDKTTATSIPCICLKDGHINYFTRNHVDRCNITCEGCRVTAYKEACSKIHREYVSYESDSVGCYVTAVCKFDGDISRIRTNHLFSRNFTCKTCTTNKYKKLCEDIEYEYLGEYLLNNWKMIVARCKHDGNIRVVRSSDICSGQIGCKVCQVNKYSKSLSRKDCKYLSHSMVGKCTYVKYVNSVGEHLEATSGQICNVKFPVSNDTHWHQRHSVYVIEAKHNGETYLKIGTANVPEVRHEQLNILCESSVKTLATYDNRFKANSLETYLHRLFSKYSANRETISEIVGKSTRRKRKSGERVRIKDGVTEWFSGSIAETLYSMEFSTIEV